MQALYCTPVVGLLIIGKQEVYIVRAREINLQHFQPCLLRGELYMLYLGHGPRHVYALVCCSCMLNGSAVTLQHHEV